MKVDQIALKATEGRSFEETMALAEVIFGLDTRWIFDTVHADGMVWPFEGTQSNIARLAFNYSKDLEIEVIEYLDGKNFHHMIPGGISHFGIHMSDDNEFNHHHAILLSKFQVIQSVETISHTSKYLNSIGRRYEYSIFDTRKVTGAATKLIRRIQRT